MRAKGTLVSAIKSFVKDNYSDEYERWIKELPEVSRAMYSHPVQATEWYPLGAAVIAPTSLIADMFFNGDVRRAARESGWHSARVSLSGIYKVFVLIATPQYIMKRGGKIMASFYDPATLVISSQRTRGVTVQVTEFPEMNSVTEWRIAGWMEEALRMCGCKHIELEIARSMLIGDSITEYVIDWD